VSALQRFNVQLRADVQGNKLVGHAAVFGQYADLRSHLEAIGATAFKRVLADAETDVRALWNHNPDHLLGRQASGTLMVGVDSEGLEFEVDLPNTTLGRDIRVLAERGDITGASFAFVPGEDDWTTTRGRRVRTHTSVERLVDVSPVTFPAYEGASVQMRSASEFDRPVLGRSDLIRARHRVARLNREV
jgi:HK97 family phage prohead protease